MGVAGAGFRVASARLEFGFRFVVLLKTKDRIGFVSSFYFGFVTRNPQDRARITYSDLKYRGVGSPLRPIVADLRKALLTRCEHSTAAAEMGFTDWRWAFVFSRVGEAPRRVNGPWPAATTGWEKDALGRAGGLRTRGRGRDAGCPAPPARIRASAPNAHGSYLGCFHAKRASGYGCRISTSGRRHPRRSQNWFQVQRVR